MMTMDKPDCFTAAYHEPGEESGLPAGVLSIDRDQRVTIMSAEAEFAARLELAASALNNSTAFMVRARPPVDAKPLSLYKRRVPREAADAREAVIELLRKEYGLWLTPVDETRSLEDQTLG